jgi:hypothetical protein
MGTRLNNLHYLKSYFEAIGSWYMAKIVQGLIDSEVENG